MAGSHAPRPKKNRDTLHNEAWLRQKYLDEELSTPQIAALLGCSHPSVQWALRKFGIPTRSISESRRGRPNTTVWTPEMRAKLAARFSGERGTNYGKPSGHRGPNYHPDERLRSVRRTRAYRRGMNGIDYDAMLAAQNGVCLTCGKPEVKRHRSGALFTLSVDHCHKTGKIRALLCNNCNAAIGLLGENIATLRAMVDYLEAHALEC